ncbi:hypothetical protein C8P63_13019 [Melghirimyces profundicolus]|uniref:Uncharacterized protein n=1 Tax=Melghirimyces profundicolus TaxID=1242148 RepID=A0A2T6B9F4_9BACL|nr:hypothetical protein C8P63_13019 [Melghirimyces profundicolus]
MRHQQKKQQELKRGLSERHRGRSFPRFGNCSRTRETVLLMLVDGLFIRVSFYRMIFPLNKIFLWIRVKCVGIPTLNM